MISHEQISILQVLIGAAVMLFSITLGLRIRDNVPIWLRNKWLAVIIMMFFFFTGYLFFIYILLTGLKFPLELITGTIFMGGAFFVYVVINISRSSIEDIRNKGVALKIEIAERGLREKELERYATGLETLDRCSRTLIQSTGDTDHFFTLICTAIQEISNADLALLPILDESGQSFTYRAETGQDAGRMLNRSVSLDEGSLCRLVIREEKTITIPDLLADSRIIRTTTDSLESSSGLGAPLWHSGKIVGALSVFRRSGAFDKVDSQLMTLFSERASIAYDNMRLLETLENRVEERTARLDAQNKLLENIISHIPSYVYWKDLQSGYLGCNPGFARLAGLHEPKDIIGLTDANLFWACDGTETIRARDKEVMETGVAVLHQETHGCDNAGNPCIFLNSQIPLKEDTGQVTGILGIIEDVTDRRTAEQAVAAERAFLQTIIDGVVEPTIVIALDYRVLLMNRAAVAYLPEGVVPGQDICCYQVSHSRDCPCDSTEHPCPMEEVQRTGKAMTVVHRHRQANGEWRSLELQASPLWNDDGSLRGIIEASRDITERLEAEEALNRKNFELEQFIYTVSHDLRSPLVTVKTFLGYLEQDMSAADSERIAKDLEFIHSAADRMEALLNELLDMARIGRAILPHEEVTFRELAAEALDAVAGQISEGRVNVQVSDTDLLLCGDRRRLLQIWQNLLDNAVKYMGDQTAPCIEFGVEQQQGDTVFYARDNGIGIAIEYQEKVFGIFEQLDRKNGGVGMGLTMVRRIVELYGGDIRVESGGEGQGSCFRFTLPGAVQQG